jgi:hypothetical protein
MVAFDGTSAPRFIVEAAWGATITPGTGVLTLGSSPGLGTAKLGGTTWVDITRDVKSYSWRRGRGDDLSVAQPGTCTIVLDNFAGDYDPANLAGPYVSGGVSLVDAGVPVRIRAEYSGTVYARFNGDITSIDLDYGYEPTAALQCSDGLEWLGRAFLEEATVAGDLDTTGQRISRLADSAGWPTSYRSIDTGYTRLGPTTFGTSALQAMHDTEQTEFGLLYVNGAGVLVFYDRYRLTTATRSTVVQAAFTDAAGVGDVEFDTLTMSRSRERAYNDVHVTRNANADGDTPVEQVATDAVSEGKYGLLSFPETVGKLLPDDDQALAMAQWLVTQWPNPTLLVTSLETQATTQSVWATLLGLDLLDLVSVSRDYGPNTVTASLLTEGMAEAVDAEAASWVINLSTAPTRTVPTLWVLGTAVLGTTSLGW